MFKSKKMKSLIYSLVTVVIASMSSAAQADLSDNIEKNVKNLDGQNLVIQLNQPRWTWAFTTPQTMINEVIRRATVKQQSKETLIALSKEVRAHGIRAVYVAETLTSFVEKLSLPVEELDEETLDALTIINVNIRSNIDYFNLFDRTLGATRNLLSQLYSKKKDYSIKFLFTIQDSSFKDGYSYLHLFDESIRNDAVEKLFEQMNHLSGAELSVLAKLVGNDESSNRFNSVFALLFSSDRIAAIAECTEETLTYLTITTNSGGQRWNKITIKWAKACARLTDDNEFNDLLKAVRERASELDPFDYPAARNGGRNFLEHLQYLRTSKD